MAFQPFNLVDAIEEAHRRDVKEQRLAHRTWLRLLQAAERGEVCIGGGHPKNQAEVDRIMKKMKKLTYEENESCVADLKPSHAYDPDGALSLLCSTNVIGDGDEPPAKKICKEGLLPVY